VADSQLVKTAFHGSDPNWGRIACAVGYSNESIRPERVTIRIGDVEVFRAGQGIPGTRERARTAMLGDEINLSIGLGGGRASARVFTCDLSAEYVELNSAYST
jgi:glutamate N-acetyltransferase/amino-acid N-acetyltransferase